MPQLQSKLNDLKDLAVQRELLLLKEQEQGLKEGLPFLYGWKWYKWAREFFDSSEKLNFLCAANQISKSSTQIRKCIDWATNTQKWPLLWKSGKPIQFWYLYPSNSQTSVEFITKWPLFLPRGKYKEDPVYGWSVEMKHGIPYAIHFNSGVHVFFKTYSQDEQHLQTGSVDAIFCDEELPVNLYDELIFRISASEGYFHMVFTATMGQEFWRQVIDPGEKEVAKLPEAAKWMISMYDCLEYEDGSPTHWTLEKIKVVENRCKNQNEVLKRVHGRFIRDDNGRRYECFDVKKHLKPPIDLPENWMTFTGVDVGGGGKSHPGAIVFVKVSPDFRQGRVFLGWRGEEHVDTTAGDIYNQYVAMKTGASVIPAMACYDWASKDFKTISDRNGAGFIAADKDHERGEQILNTLFKHNMLVVYETEELQKLAVELMTLRKDQPKGKAKDDFSDALRYAVTRIPWDFTSITGAKPEGYEEPEKPLTELERQQIARKEFYDHEKAQRDADSIQEELNEWNDLHEG